MLPAWSISAVVQAQETHLITNASDPVSDTISNTLDADSEINLADTGAATDLHNLHPVSTSDFTIIADVDSGEKQTEEGSPDSELESNLSEDDALRIAPRFGAGYNTSGGSFDDLGYFEGFVPLWQEVGEEIGFLEGRIVFGDGDDFGATLLLDYRGYNEDDNRVRGGYIGFDVRDTGESTFYQFGTGYESLGEDWDFRFNAYLPIWDRNNVIRDDTFVGDESGTTTGFAGNQLVLENQTELRRIRETEIALGGFDAEAGYRIAEWNEGEGNLTAFGGLYLYASPDTPSYLGWRLRVFSNFTPNFHGGLALQDDGLFGGRVVASVGATFGGNRPSGPISEEDRVRARLGESVVRLPEIAVTVEDDVDVTFESESIALINPGTEDSSSDEEYRFFHVQLGATGGDGTFEDPFGTVQEALDATTGDGNDIVYVDGETNVLIPEFEIPDGVRVLSQGPTQTIAGRSFPGFEAEPVRLPFATELTSDDDIIAVELPSSGDGNFPETEGVTLGDRTILSGFQITDASGDGITGNDISTVELRNNVVDGAGGNGISFTEVGDSVILFDTVVRNSGEAGIFVENTTTDRSIELSVLGYELENNDVGMELSTFSSGGLDSSPSQIVLITESDDTLNTSSGTVSGSALSNSIANNTNEGLIVRSDGTGIATTSDQTVSVEGGVITGNGGDGIQVITEAGAGAQQFDISDGEVSDNGGAGILIRNGTTGADIASIENAYAQEIFVFGSQIMGNAASGIDIGFSSFGGQEINVVDSEIMDNGGDGIRSVANGSGFQEFPFEDTGTDGITGNTITGNAGQAITVETNDAVTLAVFNVRDNDLSGNDTDPDIQVSTTAGTRSCVQITGNTAPSTSGISLETVAGVALFEVLDLDNVSFNNGGANFSVTPDESAFTDLPDGGICLQE
ncbi:MAG: right-handed parallel beta-helix repeat-containing protein [Cyanobacteria bacterium P01_F01_bin.86]